MKLIDISTPKFPNTFAMVDDEDFDRLNQWKWGAVSALIAGGVTLYVRRRIKKVNGVKKHISMHREIMNAPKDLLVDHVNSNGLDNRKENLRVCTAMQNSRNRRKVPDGKTSRFLGVSWDKKNRKFQATIRINRRLKKLGNFDSEVAAARVRDEASKQFFGEFANLNFPSKQRMNTDTQGATDDN